MPVYVATAGPLNAKRTGKFADGIITVGAADEKIEMLWDKFRGGRARSRQGPRRHEDPAAGPRRAGLRRRLEAEEQAVREWPNGGMPFPKQDIKNPEDFANMAKLVHLENFKDRMLISSDLEAHVAQLQGFVDMGFDEIYLHNVGRDQATFISTFGDSVLPRLKLS